MKKAIAIFVVFLLTISFPMITKSNTIYVHEGQSIQDAINNASDGDTIVIEGSFHENIVVNKKITLKGINATIIGKNGSVVRIASNYASIENIEIKRSDAEHAVVEVDGIAYIKNCNISYGRYGILAKSPASIENCFIYECGSGIVLGNQSLVKSCNFTKDGDAIECYGSKNIIKDCGATNCGVALVLQNASENVVEGCRFYKNNNNEADAFVLSSHGDVFYNCDISYVSFGVRMMNCTDELITGCNIHDTRYGVEYENSRGSIKNSSILNNRFGVSLTRSRITMQYNDLKNKMYNLQARFSYCDARHNYWGKIFPNKIKNQGSVILKAPWVIKPLHGEKSVKISINKERQKEEEQYIPFNHHSFRRIVSNDFDPLVNIKTIFIVRRVRSFDMQKCIVKIITDGKENESVFGYDSYPDWRAIQDVNDSKQIVTINIIVGDEKATIYYDLARGDWYGDDWLGDSDGYGHIVMKKYEIWFDVTYNDYDGDGLTYWEEVNIYHTSPYVNNAMDDPDHDGLPFWWEDKYGFNPQKWDNASLDYDKDGLTTLQEYEMYKNLSDPFAKDIFLEIDYMKDYRPSNESVELLCNAFATHNITIHVFIDDILPNKERLYYNDLVSIYWKYFLNDDMNCIKHGIFHYEVLGKYSSLPRGGHAFIGWDNLDSFVLGGAYIDEWRVGKGRRIAYASLSMHELGHTLGLFEYTFPGIDNESCNAPWMPGFWIYRNYKSCLNYRYAFQLVDYSNGKHGRNDFDDWDNIDLTFFTHSYFYP